MRCGKFSGTSSRLIKQTLQVHGFAIRLQRKLIFWSRINKGCESKSSGVMNLLFEVKRWRRQKESCSPCRTAAVVHQSGTHSKRVKYCRFGSFFSLEISLFLLLRTHDFYSTLFFLPLALSKYSSFHRESLVPHEGRRPSSLSYCFYLMFDITLRSYQAWELEEKLRQQPITGTTEKKSKQCSCRM